VKYGVSINRSMPGPMISFLTDSTSALPSIIN
jgi:hypothetical protein